VRGRCSRLCCARLLASGQRGTPRNPCICRQVVVRRWTVRRGIRAQIGPYHPGGGDHAIHAYRDRRGSGNAFRSTRQPSLPRPVVCGQNIGHAVVYNCSMRTLEMCTQEVIAGNRGFCNPNPYYRGPEAPPLRAKRKRYYY
jgi:hypothetical protein